MDDAGKKRKLVLVNYEAPDTLLRASHTSPHLTLMPSLASVYIKHVNGPRLSGQDQT